MFGVYLFFIVLLFYAFVLSVDALEKFVVPLRSFFGSIRVHLEKGSVRVILSLVGIIAGIWNFFSPDFGYPEAGPSILGALLPALALIFASTVIYPSVIEILNLPNESKRKYYDFVEKYKGIAGVGTLIAALLHILLYQRHETDIDDRYQR